jgi:hypothetical protein
MRQHEVEEDPLLRIEAGIDDDLGLFKRYNTVSRDELKVLVGKNR